MQFIPWSKDQIDSILSEIDAELAELEKNKHRRSLAQKTKTFIKKPIKSLLRKNRSLFTKIYLVSKNQKTVKKCGGKKV